MGRHGHDPVAVFCTDPYLSVSFLVICGVQQTCRRLQLNRNSSQSSLHRIQGELMLLAWTGSSSSCLDALKFRHGLAFMYF